MYAVIEDGSKQFRVKANDTIDLDTRELAEGTKTITLDRVLLVGDESKPDATQVGQPWISGASVTARVITPIKGDKIDVIKFKRRKGYRKKQGHRQKYLRVQIEKINA